MPSAPRHVIQLFPRSRLTLLAERELCTAVKGDGDAASGRRAGARIIPNEYTLYVLSLPVSNVMTHAITSRLRLYIRRLHFVAAIHARFRASNKERDRSIFVSANKTSQASRDCHQQKIHVESRKIELILLSAFTLTVTHVQAQKGKTVMRIKGLIRMLLCSLAIRSLNSLARERNSVIK